MKSSSFCCLVWKVPSFSLSMTESGSFCSCQDFEAEEKILANCRFKVFLVVYDPFVSLLDSLLLSRRFLRGRILTGVEMWVCW